MASASVDQKMDLNEIAKKNSDVEYHPEQSPGLIHQMPDPKTVILVFSTGKIVCTRAKNEQDDYDQFEIYIHC